MFTFYVRTDKLTVYLEISIIIKTIVIAIPSRMVSQNANKGLKELNNHNCCYYILHRIIFKDLFFDTRGHSLFETGCISN